MKTSAINFTGIKNTGYCWVNNTINGHKLMKINLNTQFTQADKKDYQKLIRRFPEYKNEIASDFANIEVQSDFFENRYHVLMKLNGTFVDPTNEDKTIWNFVENTVNKIKNQDQKDFVVNKSYLEGDDCNFGLIYNDDFDKYVDGTYGTIGLFGNKKLPLESHDDILEAMHDPTIVKGGANYISNLIKSINNAFRRN